MMLSFKTVHRHWPLVISNHWAYVFNSHTVCGDVRYGGDGLPTFKSCATRTHREGQNWNANGIARIVVGLVDGKHLQMKTCRLQLIMRVCQDLAYYYNRRLL